MKAFYLIAAIAAASPTWADECHTYKAPSGSK
jgi:hypothetical protein